MTSVIVICTLDRPAELARCLDAVRRSSRSTPTVWIVDASDGDETRRLAQSSAADFGLPVRYLPAPEIGLARQRNHALALAEREGVDIVHFIDDDTRVLEGYFAEIEAVLGTGDGVAGVGGVVLNALPVTGVALRRLFALYGKRPGRLLRSGRVVFGHVFRPALEDIEVEWLPGCCMSYRLDAVRGLRFDDRLEGYSFGEDFDFSNRLRATGGRLVSRGTALCFHDQSETNRWDARHLAAEQTVLLHRWVVENRRRGFSPLLFWWSFLGELALAVAGLRRPGTSWQTIRGLLAGAATVVADRGEAGPAPGRISSSSG